MRTAGALSVLLLSLFAAPPPLLAAFESPGADPKALALGSAGPAWPLDGGVSTSLESGGVFGVPGAFGCAVSMLTWDQVPELRKNAVAGRVPIRSSLLTVRLARLGVSFYSETSIVAEVARPTGGTGWGWSIAVGREGWSAGPGAAESAWIVLPTLGFAPRSGFRAAIRLEERFGAGAAAAGSAMELGVSVDPLPGWRLGSGYETARAGGFGRLKLGIECRASSAVALRMGLLPSEGTLSAGIGCRVGPLRLDVARRSHPRLGAMGAMALQLGGGGGG